jgi:XRE family aerobic/anaerobic benzoate catabolism transcriptional regulator
MTNRNGKERDGLLERLGARVRELRKRQGKTLKEMAEASGLSLRFAAQLEAGEGNIAVSRLADVASALGTGLQELLVEVSGKPGRTDRLRADIESLLIGRSEKELESAERMLRLVFGEERRSAIALLGLRGAGKTSVGTKLAKMLSLPFSELDEKIEDIAGLSLTEIFALHGEPYYRRLEAQALTDLLSRGKASVTALPGGIVNNPEAFELLKKRAITIWLKARPEDHMKRVLAQGDRRPMANRPNAMAELRSILTAREPLYEQADLTIETAGLTVNRVAEAALAALRKKGWQE